MRKRVLILISGRGSNMRSVVQACATEAWNAEVVGVVSNRPEAAGLEWAAQQGLNTHVLDHKAFATREAFDAALMALCDGQRPDVLLLAGFMRVLTEAFVTHYAGRLVNIHPSLLPAFPGLHTHRQALAAGVKLAGATVHLVTPALDHGPIIAQAAVPVRPDDTEATLAQRVLLAEHRLLPQAVRWLVEGRLSVHNGVVQVHPPEPQLMLLDLP